MQQDVPFLTLSGERLCTTGPCSLILLQRNLFPVSRFIKYRGSSDADSVRFNDCETASQIAQFGLLGKFQYELVNSQWAHAARSKQNDAGMRSRRKLSKVCKIEIQSKDHASLGLGCRSQFNIVLSQKPFLKRGGYVVTEPQKRVL